MFSESLTKLFKGFGSGFAELHVQFDAGALLDFVIHRRQIETQSRKITRVKTMRVQSAASSGRVVQ
jgi:hypothetical protein